MARTIPITALMLLLGTGGLQGQNSHYWTQQYGSESLLLGGAVIGSADDIGAAYYNPAFLALQEKTSAFMLTARIMQLTRVRLEDGLGEGLDLEKNQLGNASGLVAGTFRLNFMPKSRFTYVALTRRKHDVNLYYRNQSSFPNPTNMSGTEELTTDIVLQHGNTEIWGGMAWSRPLGDHVSIGISNFMAVSYTTSTLNIDLNRLTSSQEVAVEHRLQQYDYLNFGMNFKAGIALKYPDFSAGMVITTPQINIHGKGFMFSKLIFAGPETNVYESHYQENIPATLKAPLSIGAGAGYTLRKLQFHFSCEWFARVGHYTVMKPDSYTGQSSGERINKQIVDELLPVLNAGLGIRYSPNQKHALFMGFSTDFSAASPNSESFASLSGDIYHSSSKANFYHFSGGSVFQVGRLHLTLGLSYNYSIDYINPPVEQTDGQATLKISNWRLLMGFAFDPKES